jgi:hypothetical protein
MKKVSVLLVLFILTACAASDIIVRVTEYNADSGPLSVVGMGADGCQLAVTGSVPDDLQYDYRGTKCTVRVNGEPSDVPESPSR